MTHWLPGDIVARRKGFLMHQGVVLRDGKVLHNTPLRYAEQDERRGYNVFTNNCEHTVTRAAGGPAESPQLATLVAGVGAAAVAFALTRHPLVAAAGYALGRRVARRLTGRAQDGPDGSRTMERT